MIKIGNWEIVGWEHAIRGMRNPMNSWDKSDSYFLDDDGDAYNIIGDSFPWPDKTHRDDVIIIGENDLNLMRNLAKAGTTHSKYRRMIVVYADITAPLYWWKEFDTYKVGTVANSCSTMHKIQDKEFTLDDFSCEHLIKDVDINDPLAVVYVECWGGPLSVLAFTIDVLNNCRTEYLKTKDKKYWWQMIQLLPSSYNQKRTVMLNYEVLANIYATRKDHKLDEWRGFCKWIEELPYSEIITLEEERDERL